VPRLASAALVAWLAIIGGASPAIACAAQGPDDCCPPLLADPCSDPAPSQDSGASLSCCPATPVSAALLGSLPARAEPAKPAGSSDPEPDLCLAAELRISLQSGVHPPAAVPPRRPAADGRMTYLRTQRLRL
jgi:hypothetical protein